MACWTSSSSALAAEFRPALDAADIVMTAKNAALEPWWHRYDAADRERAVQRRDVVALDPDRQALEVERLTQLLERLDPPQPFLGRWSTKWTAIEGMRNYFNKITEELVDPQLNQVN